MEFCCTCVIYLLPRHDLLFCRSFYQGDGSAFSQRCPLTHVGTREYRKVHIRHWGADRTFPSNWGRSRSAGLDHHQQQLTMEPSALHPPGIHTPTSGQQTVRRTQCCRAVPSTILVCLPLNNDQHADRILCSTFPKPVPNQCPFPRPLPAVFSIIPYKLGCQSPVSPRQSTGNWGP